MKADILHGSDKTEKNGETLDSPKSHGEKEKSFFTAETLRRGDNKEIARIAGTYRGFARMIADQENTNLKLLQTHRWILIRVNQR